MYKLTTAEKERKQRWALANPDKIRAASRRWQSNWRRENPDKDKQKKLEWDRKNPEGQRARNALRRARKKAAQCGNPIEIREYEEILRKDICYSCNKPFEHIDHIEPLSKQGEHDWINLTASCAECNLKKSDKSLLFSLLDKAID